MAVDYEALAKQFGGADAPAVDYDALAKQFGGTDFGRQNVQAEPNRRMVRTQQMPSSDVPLPISYDKKGERLYGGQKAFAPEYVDPNQQAIKGQNILQRAAGEVIGAAEVIPSLVMSFPAAVAYGYAKTPEEQEAAKQRAAAIQYTPRTPQGRRNVELVGEAASSELLRPFQGAIGLPLNTFPKGSVAPAVGFTKALVGEEARTLAVPFQKAAESRQAAKVAESYAKGPQIDAAKEANRLGILIDPAIANPTAGNKFRGAAVDPTELRSEFIERNKPTYGNIAKKEMGLPKETPLTSSAPFDQARALVSKPYEDIKKIPELTPDANLIKSIDDLVDSTLIGGESTYNTLKSEIDSAKDVIARGASGADAIKNISNLRKKAQKTYNSNAATPEAVELADVRMGIANALEDLIEANVRDPKLLGEYRKARTAMAKTYAYERATDFNTGLLDPQKIAKLTRDNSALTGDIAAIGKVAGNFPETVTTKVPSQEGWAKFTRTSLPATIGAGIGAMFGSPVLGGVAGYGAGKAANKLLLPRMAEPGYQARAVPQDLRAPVNMLNPAQINTNRNLPVPYVMNEVLPPEYVPNFTMPRDPNLEFGAEAVRTPTPLLPPPTFESAMKTIKDREKYRATKARAAEERAQTPGYFGPEQPRPATARGVEFELDPVTGRLRPTSQGLKGATPATFEDFSTPLRTASEKISQGKAFDLDATEKIAWAKAKTDIAEIEPGFNKLSNKEVLERMMDRKWAADAIQKARDEAIAFEQIAARSKDAQVRATAQAKREQMMDLAEMLEDNLRGARPDTSRKSQGPKTREARRNSLMQDVETKNKLAR